jgi:selenide,water dikinase
MAINLERRKTVMARSIKLGHCVCNPRQGCPCDLFKQHNVCPCAGEKMPPPAGPVPLTRHVAKAGCASKIGQADLKRILKNLPPVTDPNVLLGAAAGDDAGIYRLSDQLHLVQTVDVFTPCVDDAFLFGQIAAANSLSDIYAMGGRPVTALSIVGFPIDDLDGGLLESMLQGGMAKLQEAGCALIGGHSLQDEEVKCGFAITGLVDPRRTVVRDNAQPGDVLVLTKPLGTGILSFAAQLGRLPAACLAEAGQSMATLNKDAAELMGPCQAHACTDVTGFGLLGHLVEMARNSRVVMELDLRGLPVFAAVRDCLAQDILPGAIERNQEYTMAWVRAPDESGLKNLPVLYDAQTSGGLLVSLPEAAAAEYLQGLHQRGHPAAAVIGRVARAADPGHEGEVVIVNSQLAHWVGTALPLLPAPMAVPASPAPAPAPAPAAAALTCCASPAPGPAAAPAPVDAAELEASALFANFMERANQPGLIGQRHKKLMAIALSVAQRCQPCLLVHIRAALAQGIPKAEIDEAAWLGIAFAGCPAMVFYREVCKELKI